MRSFTVDLNPDRDVTLHATVYDLPAVAERPTSLEDPRPAVIICPGGGYTFLSQRETDPPAAAFLAAGFDTFVLRYSIGVHATGPNPAIDVARAARGVEANAGLMTVSSRPDAVLPAYAVFNFDWKPEDFVAIGVEYQDCIAAVTDEVPPVFLWTTDEDQTVPPSQSLRFAQALSAACVPFEYHHFQRGVHGLATGTQVANNDRPTLPENVAAWGGLATAWLRATWAAR